MASQFVQSMPQIEPDAEIGLNLAPRWRIRLEGFQMYLAAHKKKRALLLYQADPRVRDFSTSSGKMVNMTTPIKRWNF